MGGQPKVGTTAKAAVNVASPAQAPAALPYVTQDVITSIKAHNTTLGDLLQDIYNADTSNNKRVLADSADAANIHPKIATYAGVKFNASGQPEFDSTKLDLDKLTFCLMFRIPFSTEGKLSSHYGNPFTGTSWTKRANDIRVAAQLKRLNEAGEQVDANKVRCDNGGATLGNYDNPAAWDYYLSSWFFGNIASDEVPITDAAFISGMKVLPIFYFLTVYTENKPQPSQFTRVIHVPENTVGEEGGHEDKSPKPKYSRRRILLGLYEPLGAFLENPPDKPEWVDRIFIQREPSLLGSSRYYTISKNISDPLVSFTFVRYYIKLAFDEEDLSQEKFDLEHLQIVADTSTKPVTYYASYLLKYKGTGERQYDKIAVPQNSGFTFGMGYDLGAHNAGSHYYEIVFDILTSESPTASTYILGYGDQFTDPIRFDETDASKIAAALAAVIGVKGDADNDASIVNVAPTTIGDASHPKGWHVTIQRRQTGNRLPKEGEFGFASMYQHSFFYHPGPTETTPNVKILPVGEAARWKVRSAAVSRYQTFVTFMNSLYADGKWLNPQHHATGFDATAFEDVIKKALGIQNGPAKVLYKNYEYTVDRFKLPPGFDLYLKWYGAFYKKTHYDNANLTALKTELGDDSNMNLPETLLYTSISYGGIGKLYTGGKAKNGVRTDIINAIRSHSYNRLRTLFIETNPTLPKRRAFLVAMLQKMKSTAYRGVEG